MAAIDGALRRGECYQLLGRDDDQNIVSFATLERIKMNPARAHVIEVKRMASKPEVRGFGGYLLAGWREILNKCAELGCDLITIDVSEDGPYRLWQKLGFRIYATMEDYARVGNRRLQGHFLSLTLEDAYKTLGRLQASQARPAQEETKGRGAVSV
jgi:GNAT superfamily N-acetyltransferase